MTPSVKECLYRPAPPRPMIVTCSPVRPYGRFSSGTRITSKLVESVIGRNSSAPPPEVWLPIIAAAELSPLTFHDLRHTHASLLIAQGEHPKVISERLGHSSIAAAATSIEWCVLRSIAICDERILEVDRHYDATGYQPPLPITPRKDLRRFRRLRSHGGPGRPPRCFWHPGTAWL